MVSFGVAPAMVIYEFALITMERYALLPAFIYVACAALRLARFNVAKISDKKFFIGIPSPGAAGLLASIIWVCLDYQITPEGLEVVFAAILVCLGLAMVSNIKYRSFKDFEFKGKIPFVGLILVVLVISLIYLDPPVFFLLIGSVYFVSGAVTYFIRLTKRTSVKQAVMDTVAELAVDSEEDQGSDSKKSNSSN